jgi:hypothetical protein
MTVLTCGHERAMRVQWVCYERAVSFCSCIIGQCDCGTGASEGTKGQTELVAMMGYLAALPSSLVWLALPFIPSLQG